VLWSSDRTRHFVVEEGGKREAVSAGGGLQQGGKGTFPNGIWGEPPEEEQRGVAWKRIMKGGASIFLT